MEGRQEDKHRFGKTGRISIRTSGAGSSTQQGISSQADSNTPEKHTPRQFERAAMKQGRSVHVNAHGPDQPPADFRGISGDPGEIPPEEKLNAVYRLTTGLVQQMEKARIAEYTQLLNSPWRLVWLNVLSGTARGLGIALGFTFFAATIIYVLQVLGALNLPIIGDYIADIVRIVQHQLELKTF
ncbi:hypothetical protein PRIO_5109 [Paenibacillus riograndensis SBR5]|uniref:Uncharacterized protein n=2 Tax=Paenibacillus riograndensis TaxID=483937 RepID=A0A0E3WIR7_9BACL|nr:hypothetical protein PRIO_5109 [Paenibacillus riograndensis SBR5]